MNYGEELGYWYLRLNGFFPVTNFVIHKTEGIEDRSDFDLIAVRPPHVFEEIGGNESDWDDYLKGNIDFTKYVGILCEVKTGQFDTRTIFREHYLKTGVQRLGLFQSNEVDSVVHILKQQTGFPNDATHKEICKLLISPIERPSGKYLTRSIMQVEDFILNRIEKYAKEKFASRMFFPSPMFQLLIAQIERRKRG